METSQNNTTSRVPIVDFVPAEIKKGRKGNWRIEYYVADPTSNFPNLKRIQHRVRPMANQRERERFAKRMCYEINRKLERGWNKFIEDEASNSFVLLKDVIKKYLKEIEKQVKDNSLREDTLRAYRSYLSNLEKYLKTRDQQDMFCLKFNRQLVGGFLDHIYFDRNNSPRTYNNYLGFLSVFSKYMIRKDHINANPVAGLQKKPKGEKKRTVISDKDLKEIFDYLKANDHPYAVACAMMYFGLIRRTEMSKMLVSDINLRKRLILVRPEVSKNGKSQTVTIMEELIPYLIDHLNGAHNSDFLFSQNGLKTGMKRTQPKFFSDQWTKLKKKMDLPSQYHFYSLKDTGITNLLRAGVPAIHVRDHARHSDIAMTQKYTPMSGGVSGEFLDGKLKM